MILHFPVDARIGDSCLSLFARAVRHETNAASYNIKSMHHSIIYKLFYDIEKININFSIIKPSLHLNELSIRVMCQTALRLAIVGQKSGKGA